LLGSLLLVDGGLDELDDELCVEVHGRILELVELVSDLGCQINLLGPLHSKQLMTPLCLLGDVLFDKLVGRNVDHVPLDGQVGTGSVNTESLFVVDEQNSRSELTLESLASRLN